MSSLRITVIIPSFKRPRDLRRCLAAVAVQSRPADEVLIVSRESDVETSSLVSALIPGNPSFRVVPVAEPGLIAAMNCGLDNAMGDLLAFTDDDAEAQTDWLERVEAAFGDPSVGAVGGRDWIQLPDEPALFRPAEVSKVGVLTWYGIQYGNHHCPLRGHTRRVMFLKGVNMAFRRLALVRYRVDIRLRGKGTQLGSELDLCGKIRQAGFDVLFDDRILVKHYSSPRATGDDRSQLMGSVFLDLCYNNHYLTAKGFGFYRTLAYFCHGRLLGSRSVPGLLASLKWYFKGDRHVWQRLAEMTRVGIAGLKLGWQARAEAEERGFDAMLDSTVIEIEGQVPGCGND